MEPYHAPTQDAPPVEPPGTPIDEVGATDPPLLGDGLPAVTETLESLARDGARRMLERALHAEVDAHLGRHRYDRSDADFTGYRNGFARDREITIGTWSVEDRPPRVSDTPGHIPAFRSSILPRGRALSSETQRLFARLYLEGLSSGDFEPALRELVGERAPLSSSTILRLREEWKLEYAAWRVRPIRGRFAYLWCDGLYVGVGTETEHSCLLVIVGGREDGRKELLAMELGYQESTNSWADGLAGPLLAIGDGALGLWAALRDVFPTTRHQRCWNQYADLRIMPMMGVEPAAA
jgi:transposase-like protein